MASVPAPPRGTTCSCVTRRRAQPRRPDTRCRRGLPAQRRAGTGCIAICRRQIRKTSGVSPVVGDKSRNTRCFEKCRRQIRRTPDVSPFLGDRAPEHPVHSRNAGDTSARTGRCRGLATTGAAGSGAPSHGGTQARGGGHKKSPGGRGRPPGRGT
jgi:hypothetical protein